MKFYILCDIEGVASLTCWDEARSANACYAPMAREMSLEAAAAARGLFCGGADEVVIEDMHGDGIKYYFTDMGLRNARLNFRQIEETHSMENIIFNELKMRGFNVDVGVIVQYDTNDKGNSIRKQLEIDFV